MSSHYGPDVVWDDEKLIPRMTRYQLHSPHVTQQAALLCDHRELLFGGAGGGGKSDLLLMGALQYVDFPEYGATIYRRTYPQLKQRGGLIPRAQEWLEDTDAVGAEKDSGYFTRWDFPSGAQLSFRHMQHWTNKDDSQGGDMMFVGIDELGQFTEDMAVYLFSRLRRPKGSKVPTRLWATANPGGPGHDFIMDRFNIPPAVVNKAILSHGGDRVFIPSKLSDNPSIDREDYLRNLAMLDPVTRRQIELGDWSARKTGDFFEREWWVIVDAAPKQVTRRFRYWDTASSKPKPGTEPDWTVGTLMSVRGSGEERIWCVEDVVRFREGPAEKRKRIRSVAESDGSGVVVCFEEEGGASGKDASDQYRRQLAGFTVRTPRPTGDKANRAGPFATSAQNGQVEVVRGPWLSAWLSELDAFYTPGVHDDQVDSASGAYNELCKGTGFEDFYGEEAA